jgi:hypothetical protein
MKFGSKGLDAPTIIGIIVAIIIAIVILYILWTRGMLPFGGAADRNTCLAELMNACNTASINVKSIVGGGKVNTACTAISDINTKCGSCITSGCAAGDANTQANFNTCCTWVNEQARA